MSSIDNVTSVDSEARPSSSSIVNTTSPRNQGTNSISAATDRSLLWSKEFDLSPCASVIKGYVTDEDVIKRYQASLDLLSALSKGTPQSFDPQEQLSCSVNFDDATQPGIKMWITKPESKPKNSHLRHLILLILDVRLVVMSRSSPLHPW